MRQEFAGPIGMAHSNQTMCDEDTNLGGQPTVVGVGCSERFA